MRGWQKSFSQNDPTILDPRVSAVEAKITKIEQTGLVNNADDGKKYEQSWTIENGVMKLILTEKIIPITLNTVAYESLSYKDIFETNNIITNGIGNSLTGWQLVGGQTNTAIVTKNEKSYFEHDTSVGNSMWWLFNFVSGESFYYIKQAFADGAYPSNGIRTRLFNGSTSVSNDAYWFGSQTQEQVKYFDLTATANGDRFLIGRTGVGGKYWFRNVFLINKKIFTTPPTQTKMLELHQQYLQIKGVA